MMDQIQSYFRSNRDRFIEEWRRFLAFASISADPAYDGACLDCAKWLVEHLSGIGFRAELLPTETKPMVYGELPGDPSKPTVLFYGHYDVQPIDPRELWSSDPFEPVLRDDGRLYARGAQDNKGQVAYFLKGVEALRACGSALPTIKVLLEGEEESGSQGMYAHLESHRERIKADILMVCDTGTLAPGVPTITMGLRGIAHFDVRVFGPNADIHSGVYGGVVLNPIQALCAMLSSLHRSDGSIAVPGFYDGVVEPSEQDRALANAAPLEVAQLIQELGVDLEGGETKYTVIERRGFRPTVEINGVGGGYQGEGTKTVIPSMAFAKISTRLVNGQDPQRALDALTSHLKACAPRGVRVEVCHERVGGAAFGLSTSSPLIKKAREGLERAFGRDPVFMWEGASVPVIPFLSEVSGAEPLLIGFGLPEDRIHSPNESFSLQQFEDGYRYVTTFLSSV